MNRNELVYYLNDRLGIDAVEDVSVNGLQVEGRTEVNRVALATDAALSVYRKAADLGCDMIVAHHGLIWGGLKSITGRSYEHVRFLIERGINLYAVHLPLDAHAELGNNAALARVVGMTDLKPFGWYRGAPIGFSGTLPRPMSPDGLAEAWRVAIGGEPLILPFGKSEIRTVGIVSGGGSSSLGEALSMGLDCFVTGEGRHDDHHQAAEGGISVIYLGHYHSETLGVRAVGDEVTARFGIETVFIDEPTII